MLWYLLLDNYKIRAEENLALCESTQTKPFTRNVVVATIVSNNFRPLLKRNNTFCLWLFKNSPTDLYRFDLRGRSAQQ